METEWERDVKFHEDGICLEVVVVVVVALIVAKGVGGDVDGSGRSSGVGDSCESMVYRNGAGGGRIVYRSGGGGLCRSG